VSALTTFVPVSLCTSCGLDIPDGVDLCPHHQGVYGGHEWAVANRIMCDFFHRGRAPRRLTEAERDDDVNTATHTSDGEGYILLQITRASEA
jgi:hypothetical protein